MYYRVILVFFLLCAACQERIIHDLNELDANKIISKLHLATIQSTKEKQADGLWSIAVPQAKVVEAIQLIEDYRFFKKPENFESRNKLLRSEEEEKLHYQSTLAQQLETTLQSLPGVLEAHVHINLSQSKSLWKNESLTDKESTAGVLLIVNHQFALTSNELKDLVGGASGILAKKISIVVNFPPLLEMSDSNIEKVIPENIKESEQYLLDLNPMLTMINKEKLLIALWVICFLGILLYLLRQYYYYGKVKQFKLKQVTHS